MGLQRGNKRPLPELATTYPVAYAAVVAAFGPEPEQPGRNRTDWRNLCAGLGNLLTTDPKKLPESERALPQDAAIKLWSHAIWENVPPIEVGRKLAEIGYAKAPAAMAYLSSIAVTPANKTVAIDHDPMPSSSRTTANAERAASAPSLEI